MQPEQNHYFLYFQSNVIMLIILLFGSVSPNPTNNFHRLQYRDINTNEPNGINGFFLANNRPNVVHESYLSTTASKIKDDINNISHNMDSIQENLNEITSNLLLSDNLTIKLDENQENNLTSFLSNPVKNQTGDWEIESTSSINETHSIDSLLNNEQILKNNSSSNRNLSNNIENDLLDSVINKNSDSIVTVNSIRDQTNSLSSFLNFIRSQNNDFLSNLNPFYFLSHHEDYESTNSETNPVKTKRDYATSDVNLEKDHESDSTLKSYISSIDLSLNAGIKETPDSIKAESTLAHFESPILNPITLSPDSNITEKYQNEKSQASFLNWMKTFASRIASIPNIISNSSSINLNIWQNNQSKEDYDKSNSPHNSDNLLNILESVKKKNILSNLMHNTVSEYHKLMDSVTQKLYFESCLLYWVKMIRKAMSFIYE